MSAETKKCSRTQVRSACFRSVFLQLSTITRLRKNSNVTTRNTLFACFLLVPIGCRSRSSDKKEQALCATCVVADEHGFAPSHIDLQQGGPGSSQAITFTRTSNETCATAVVFPEMQIEKDLPLGVPVSIDVPTDRPRTIAFQCGMGMYKSAIVIR